MFLFFFQLDSKNWSFFSICLNELNLFLEYDPTEIELFSIWLKEFWNFSKNMTHWLEPFFAKNQKLLKECFEKKKVKKWLQELIFLNNSQELNPFFFTWLTGIEPFFFTWLTELNPFFSTWLIEFYSKNFFDSQKWFNPVLKNDSKNWTLLFFFSNNDSKDWTLCEWLIEIDPL